MRVTIEQIASEAGVSTGTVSRILNGKNQERRPSIVRRSARVREIAGRLGYRPNAAARSMSSGRFGLTAFVTCGEPPLDWFPRALLHGLHDGLEPRGERLVFHDLPAARFADPAYVPQLFRENGVDGMVVHLNPAFADRVRPIFAAQPLPCVWVNLRGPRGAVYPDDRHGARLAVRHLVARGHREIGYFRRQYNARGEHYSVAERLDGFRRAMASAGLDGSRVHPPAGSPARDRAPDGAGVHASLAMAAAFLDAHPRLTAAVCYEAEEALCLLQEAARRGRRVPDDSAVVAFAEREVRSTTGITFPTAVVPFHEVGRRSADLLADLIAAGTPAADAPSIAVRFGPIRE